MGTYPRPIRESVFIAAFGVCALVVASCGNDADTTAGGSSSTTTVTSSSTTIATQSTVVDTPDSSTTSSTTSSLPGEPIDIGPRAGDVLSVVGVRYDDVLNLRSGPGVDLPVMVELSPETDDLHAEGAARLLPESIWYEVVAGDTAGWVNSRYVGYAGGVDDATAEVVASLGAIPMAETMVDLGTLVAETVASEDPPSRITIAVAPSVGDLGEITMDVIGLGDDSVLGFRLHVFGQPDGEGFSLRTVERMVLCGRGVSGEICV